MVGGLRGRQLGPDAWWRCFSAGPWGPAVGLPKLVSPFSLTHDFHFSPPFFFWAWLVDDLGLLLILFCLAALDLMQGEMDGMPSLP